MRRRVIDVLQRHAIIEAASDPSNEATPNWLERALDELTPEEIASILWYEMNADLEQGIADARAVLKVKGGFDVTPDRALKYLADHVMDFATGMVEDERAGLKALITQSVAEGTGAKALKREISSYFAGGVHYVGDDGKTVERTVDLDAWAETVSRTELSRAYNQGSRNLYEEAGITERVWVAAGDAHECPECEAADGTTARLGDAFNFVDVEDPPAHPRCYCVTMASPEAIAKYQSDEEVQRRADELEQNRAYSRAHGGRMG